MDMTAGNSDHKGPRGVYEELRVYSVVDRSGFTSLIKTLEPRYEVPSRTHFSNKVIPELYSLDFAKHTVCASSRIPRGHKRRSLLHYLTRSVPVTRVLMWTGPDPKKKCGPVTALIFTYLMFGFHGSCAGLGIPEKKVTLRPWGGGQI